MNSLFLFIKEYVINYFFLSGIFILSLLAAESEELIFEIMNIKIIFALVVYVVLAQLCLYKFKTTKQIGNFDKEGYLFVIKSLIIATFLFSMYFLVFLYEQINLFFLLILLVSSVVLIPGVPTISFKIEKISRRSTLINGQFPSAHKLANSFWNRKEKIIKSKMNKINVKDLIGRDIIEPTHRISEYITNKSVLITGAGGSIGSELVKQVAKYNPGSLILLGHGENSIFSISADLKEKFPQTQTHLAIADIQDKYHIEQIFHKYKPNIVFHAAAHKHVPLMEINEGAAVRNNIFGTENLVWASSKFGVERFVFISTDKAVEPKNIMGKTKRIGELIVQSIAAESLTKFSIVRFGNVLESRGSVIPIFKKQIESGGPVTVTHPNMVRYFMTIPEAVQLVLEAGALSNGGEVFVLDMGEPVKIIDIAKKLICLSGYIPDKDIRIEFTGIRPGEKLNESLFYSSEEIAVTKHPHVMIAVPKIKNNGNLAEQLKKLKEATTHSPEEIGDLLDKIIQNYNGK
ncbi:UDP-N-acetylglucosamine 4,6-dehydratase family protein [Cytobacillus sp. NCCP-133]|uniref:UDP-N-acetylglucosamine 4,6-dehydratase family protein n=1 Tax=Cytobacillus sp. NCCP-133 TaxID=766848 RepID=UPI00222F89F5|nr:polysaccharide biosynthesis protein [Cytobacillus sp. NCCP-133]GLB62110.1 hypothetical protein NCCP133_42390 [Cytobacillus sp. NCCP-133]